MPAPEATYRIVETNGIRMHIAEQGSGPTVLLCHGFPECWYFLAASAECAGDEWLSCGRARYARHGQTDAPQEIDRYTLLHLVGDMLGVARRENLMALQSRSGAALHRCS